MELSTLSFFVQPHPYMARGARAHTGHVTCPLGHMTSFKAPLGRP